ncbi:MAG: hypothetical protein DHS20C11_10170 [Lysobacteraceae bacterium]|nr:MAG: hypothetical protein DHS20C11_10170 [Xanthomonadaceae bacterium]
MQTLVLLFGLMMLPPAKSASDALPSTRYIIEFHDTPALHYGGEIPGLEATGENLRSGMSGRRERRHVDAYLTYLASMQSEYLAGFERQLGRPMVPRFRYRVATNGIAIELHAEEVELLKQRDEVRRIFADQEHQLLTDAGPQWIGAESIWTGTAMGASMASKGEGVVVGIIDSGINMDHPSFSDTPEDGHKFDNPFGDGVFVGACDGVTFICNNKLIGAWDFADGGVENDGPEDSSGHGTHVAATAVGNTLSGPFVDTYSGIAFSAPSISGVAPHANIIAYDVCSDTCLTSSMMAAIDQAILDGVDVINFSIAGGLSPWTDIDRQFLDAVSAGITVVTAAGNNGSAPVGAVIHLGPWMITAGNQSHNRINTNAVSVDGGGPELQSMYGLLGSSDLFAGIDVDAVASYAGAIDPANFEGCSAWPMGDEFDGEIALISRGTCGFSTKINHASNAGAVAVLIFNHLGIAPFPMTGIGSVVIPSLMVGKSDGEAMVDFLQLNPASMVTMSGITERVLDDDFGGVLYRASSRGPNLSMDITKPDIAAPGTLIFSAVADAAGAAPQFSYLTGTSASSPHVAGAAALLKSLHPSWTPAQIRSALMMSAAPAVAELGGPSNADEQGAGTVNLDAATGVGLVMDETFSNYLAADPAMGGDPATLNLPSMRSNDCAGDCSWQRTVCMAEDSDSQWVVDTSAPVGTTLQATPPTFSFYTSDTLFVDGFNGVTTLSACATIDITLTIADPQLVIDDEFVFGEVRLMDASGDYSEMRLSVAALPTGTSP